MDMLDEVNIEDGAEPTPAEVVSLVTAMSVSKRWRSGTHLAPQSGVVGTVARPPVPARAKGATAAKPTQSHPKAHSLAPRGTKNQNKSSAILPAATAPAPQGGDIANGATNVLDAGSRDGDTSFMDMLDEVNIAAPPLALSDDGEAQVVDEDGEEDDDEDDEGEEDDGETLNESQEDSSNNSGPRQLIVVHGLSDKIAA
nr:uncharacterized protein LOC127315778 [Lolium perenne]